MANTKIKLQPLAAQELAAYPGFNCMAIITANHLTETAANTAQSFDLGGELPAGAIIKESYVDLVVPFEDQSDAAFNTTGVIVGDAGDDDRYITVRELNRNATEITIPAYNNTAYELTTAATLVAKISAMALKALNDIDKGELAILFAILQPRHLTALKSNSVITK